MSIFPTELIKCTSESGRAYVIKSLHPSSVQPDFEGIPGGSSTPIVLCEFQNNMTISPPDVTKTWTCDIIAAAHILSQYTYAAVTTDGATTTTGVSYNTQLGGDPNSIGINSVVNNIAGIVADMRPDYISLTIHYDAPALTNQGSVTCAQYTLAHSEMNYPLTGSLSKPVWIFNDDQIATFATMKQMPNAYTSEARNGVYVPVKLGKDSRKWIKSAETVDYTNQLSSVNAPHASTLAQSSFSTSGILPFKCGTQCGYSGGAWNPGTCSFKLSSDQFSHISFVNLSGSGQLVVSYRAGWECHVRPSTTLSAFQRSSPEPDAESLVLHDLIIRNLMDGYEESYNDSNKLMSVIAKIAQVVSKYVSPFLTILNPIVGTVTRDVADFVDRKVTERLARNNNKPNNIMVAPKKPLPVKPNKPLNIARK